MKVLKIYSNVLILIDNISGDGVWRCCCFKCLKVFVLTWHNVFEKNLKKSMEIPDDLWRFHAILVFFCMSFFWTKIFITPAKMLWSRHRSFWRKMSMDTEVNPRPEQDKFLSYPCCCSHNLISNFFVVFGWSGRHLRTWLLQLGGGHHDDDVVGCSSQVKSSQVKSSQVKSSQVKSSQVKSSQVKSSHPEVKIIVGGPCDIEFFVFFGWFGRHIRTLLLQARALQLFVQVYDGPGDRWMMIDGGMLLFWRKDYWW